MSLTIPEANIWYGPTPLSTFSGESVGFRFDIHVDAPDQYSQIEGAVTIYDSSQQVVAQLNAMLPAASVVYMQLAWDGHGPNGPLPPGDYAPTFSAKAGKAQVSTPSCTGITVVPPPCQRNRDRCQRDPCRQQWTCPKEPRDETLISGPDTPLPTASGLVAMPRSQPGASVPTVALS